ncbi:hypothetical protein F4781DRAFT_51556 [Annulohypoxylon bovei var. microspora]|nr:hypothetical protein F4781DRAFT_51556 [Annulohypoxylon bovei var. microspora]
MPPYSTLEVRGVQGYYPHDSGETEKEAVPLPDTLYPQLAAFETDRTGTYFPEVVNHERGQPPSNPPPFQEQPQEQPQEKPQQQPNSRICGLPRRKFYLALTAGILVIIAAIAGGVAGGLASKQHFPPKHGADNDGSQANNGTTATRPNVNVLALSKLAASNRTDLDGHTHRTVFFQDPSSALVARRWDSVNATWETTNLTAVMRDTATPLNLLPGAPLAAASCLYAATNASETHLWFAAPDNAVSALRLMAPEADPDGWEYDDLSGARIETLPGTQIAAVWQRCWRPGCAGSWIVAYQTPDGDIGVANATAWASPQVVVQERAVALNSSLALVAQIEGAAVDRVILVSESLGTGEVGTMQKSMYVGGWDADGSLIESIPPPAPNLQFAMTVQNNFTETTTMALLPNGTVTALLWAGHFRPIPRIDFRGGPEVNFSAIAASEDAMIYGISGDEVLQYKPDEADIFSYVYVGRVYP